MFKRTKVSMAAVIAIGTLVGTAALAQDAQRVEITGSSIKRIAAEGALPVVTLTKQDIERSGATSARELIQNLPSMQGFTAASDSVNGGGGGTTTASLRNLGSQYTLVLLNGRRVAPFNTGSTVNLEQLPLASIERVEVLTDGASTLYGADAIAGVVNFITKKNSTDGAIDLKFSSPQRSGGKEVLASVSKGFGNLDTNGFNLLAGLSYEKVDKITAAEREWSRSGFRPFTHNGQNLALWQMSANSNPPNLLINGGVLGFYNPVLKADGNCGTNPGSFVDGGVCRFDYASTVEAQPEAERLNLYLSGQMKLGKDFTAFAEALISDVSLTSRFAPPAQPLSLAKGSALYNKYVLPTLPDGVTDADVTSVTYLMRLSDAGLRGNKFSTEAKHLVVGIEGSAFSFDGSATFTHSTNKQTNEYDGGYTSRTGLLAAIAANKFDPWAQDTAASKAGIASSVLTGVESQQESSLDVASLRASRPIFNVGGGSAYLGFGVDFMRQSYSDDPSAMSQGPNKLQPNYSDFPVGSGQGSLPFDTSRKSTGAYAELLVPLTKNLEVTGALRYDSYDAAVNKKNFDTLGNPIGSAEQGNSASKSTYKLAMRFQPMQSVLLRASIGTGFRAPTLDDITDPLKEFGVISTQRPCPVGAGDPLFEGCRPLPTQWKLQTGGNPFTGEAGLKPESSDQWNIGVRFEPTSAISAGIDLWSVKVKDVITVVPEDTAFDNFERYRSLFNVTTEGATGLPILTFNQVPLNGAAAKSTGIDLDVTMRANTGFGKFTGTAGATYLIESWYDYGFGGGKESSVGQLGSDDAVAFRTLLKLSATLETGAFTNTFNISWKPGYQDQKYGAADGAIRVINPDGTRGAFVGLQDFRVGSYTLVDWQGRWDFNKSLSLTAGIKNLFDKEPPFSVKNVAGNMLGFDPRYADGVGRTFSLAGSFKF